jgi:hypothetical protein
MRDKEGTLRLIMKYGRMRGNKRKATIGTAHTVTVNSLMESINQSINHSLATRVCFYVSKAVNRNEWETTEHSPDLVTLTIYLGGRTLHIHNCYNPPPKLLTSRNLATLQLLPQALSHQGEHMLVGDFNLHHPLWGGTLLPTQHTLADDLIEAITHSSMELILP